MNDLIINKNLCNYVNSPSPNVGTLNAIADSGTTIHCLCTDSPSMDDKMDINGIRAIQPDGSPITSNATCKLRLTNLPEGARKAYKFPQQAGNALISLPVLCDNGCDVKLTRNAIVVTKDGQEVTT